MPTKKIPCPQCSKSIEWSTENPYRPFCSERCKMLDLGAWANEEYQIPAQINTQEDDFSTSMSELEHSNYKNIH